jgi:hypothetical protein
MEDRVKLDALYDWFDENFVMGEFLIQDCIAEKIIPCFPWGGVVRV